MKHEKCGDGVGCIGSVLLYSSPQQLLRAEFLRTKLRQVRAIL
jgi:hypothetical protein